MRANHKAIHIISTSAHDRKPATRRVTAFTPLMKHVNTSTVAFVMFVALAFLSSTHGKDPATGDSTRPKASKPEVIVDNYTFSPQVLSVPKGGTVTWINHDNVPHVIASADNQFQKSPALKTGQSFTHTFATAGVYSYFCSIHPRMTGKIIIK
ncbi:MAG TPA: cupredoxin domain-containing protein [Chthoniobacterales bacterium]|jgi:plastocyanin